MGWGEEEFKTIDLGDERLNRRAALLAERLGQKPSASIPGACESWEKVLAPYWQASQDTTELDYNGQAIAGLGRLNYEAQRGLYLHPTYVVSPEREPLGVFSAWTWAREFKTSDGRRAGPCESIRWIESYERIAESAQALPGTRHVCIGDRESDILDLMVKARDLGYPAVYLVRSCHSSFASHAHAS